MKEGSNEVKMQRKRKRFSQSSQSRSSENTEAYQARVAGREIGHYFLQEAESQRR